MNLDDDDTVDELPAPPRQAIPAADRELLELAARALGAVQVEDVEGENWVNLHFADGSTVFHWNPLMHGDDALHLSSQCKIDIHHGSQWVETIYGRNKTSLSVIAEYFRDEKSRDEALRRVITRAAAEIGKQRS